MSCLDFFPQGEWLNASSPIPLARALIILMCSTAGHTLCLLVIKEGISPQATVRCKGIFLIILLKVHHWVVLWGHSGETSHFSESLPQGQAMWMISPDRYLPALWEGGVASCGWRLHEVCWSDRWLTTLWQILFSYTEHSLLPRFPLIETQKEKCQAIKFKQKGLRQFISHFSNFAVYICKPQLFTCPVFVTVNSFGVTT